MGSKLVLLVAKRQLRRLNLCGAVKAFLENLISTCGWSLALTLNVSQEVPSGRSTLFLRLLQTRHQQKISGYSSLTDWRFDPLALGNMTIGKN